MSISGTPNFQTLMVAEMAAEIRGSSILLTGKAAFVDRDNHTHGYTKGEGAVWSRETIEKLLALVASMEADLARLHFTEYSSGSNSATEPRPAQLGGISEHLAEADQA